MIGCSLEDVDSLISSNYQEEDIYGTTDVQLDCLLPTGVYIPLRVDRWTSVRQVKEVRSSLTTAYFTYSRLFEQFAN